MSSAPQPKTKSRRRMLQRWGIRLVLLGLCLACSTLLYLNQVGLPDFAKSMLQQELAANGLNLEFDRLRWGWQQGLVAEQIQLEVTRTNTQPTLTAESLKIQLNRQALLTGKPEVTSVMLANAQLGIPVPGLESELPELFEINKVRSQLSFPSPNQWLLESFQAECMGIQLELTAEITNAFAIRSWQRKPKDPGSPPKWPKVLRQLTTIRDQLTFAGTPTLKIHLHTDAARPEQSSALITLSCEAMDSPWGDIKHFSLQLATEEIESKEDTEFGSSCTLTLGELDRESMSLRNLHLTANLVHDSASGRILQASWTLNSGSVEAQAVQMNSFQVLGNSHATNVENDEFLSSLELVLSDINFPDGQVARVRASSEFHHREFTPEKLSGEWTATATGINTRWASVDEAQSKGSIKRATASQQGEPDRLDPFKSLRPWEIQAVLSSQKVGGPTIEADSLELGVRWTSPQLQLSRITGSLYRGALDMAASIDVDTRYAQLDGWLDFNVKRIGHLLGPKGQRWLDQYTYENPPLVNVSLGATLPAWDDPKPDWKGEVKPTMSLAGNVDVERGAFRGVPVESATTDFTFTNMVWRLPNLHITRPEGILDLIYECDSTTQDYRWDVDALVDFKVLTPLLSTNQKQGLALFDFQNPVKTTGEIWGRWHAPDRTGFKTQISTTDFAFREVPLKTFRSAIDSDQGIITLRNLQFSRPEGFIQADWAQYSNHSRLISVTNALSTIDSTAIAKMIGPKIERSFKSYRFAKPPRIEVNGIIPIDGDTGADAHFSVDGGPFSFWKFNVPAIQAKVDWVDRDVLIRDVNASFYQGGLNGRMGLKLKKGKGADFDLDATVSRADLNQLFQDVFSPENKSEGSLSGRLSITSGQTENWNSWQGNGNLRLREGFLWDIPLFGVFSPVLNTVSEGLGNSRAGTGNANFEIADSVIYTSDLTIQEPTTRLQYQGKLDFAGNLDARVEAELLRDTPMVGRVMSLALWPLSKLFVFKVSGSLGKPIAEPIYGLPKFLLNPIETIRNREN